MVTTMSNQSLPLRPPALRHSPRLIARACDDVVAVQAGCVCGWRSSYLPFLHEPARWYPFDVVVDEADEARCQRLHHEHIGSLEAPR